MRTAEHTVWIVYTPGPFAREPACFTSPIAGVDQFVRNFGTRRMVEDRVTFYRYTDDDAAKTDAAERFANRTGKTS